MDGAGDVYRLVLARLKFVVVQSREDLVHAVIAHAVLEPSRPVLELVLDLLLDGPGGSDVVDPDRALVVQDPVELLEIGHDCLSASVFACLGARLFTSVLVIQPRVSWLTSPKSQFGLDSLGGAVVRRALELFLVRWTGREGGGEGRSPPAEDAVEGVLEVELRRLDQGARGIDAFGGHVGPGGSLLFIVAHR